MTNSEMIKTLNKIMLINYNSCYKVLTKDGTYAVPFEQEVNALKHAISLLEAERDGKLVKLSCKS